jgi:hypothetical protein
MGCHFDGSLPVALLNDDSKRGRFEARRMLDKSRDESEQGRKLSATDTTLTIHPTSSDFLNEFRLIWN